MLTDSLLSFGLKPTLRRCNMAGTKTFVEFLYPGVMFDETSVSEVKTRDWKKLNVPERAFGFRFFDIMETEEDGVKLQSSRLNQSPIHYYGGRVMTIDEVREEMPEARILISNMECNNWHKVVCCRTGNFKPFENDDIFIQAK